MFPLAAALGALLLFAVQPIIGSALLPWFGGAAAVWTVCLVFFQVALVGGYAYAHWLEGRFAGRGVRVHLVVLAGAAITLPILPSPRWQPSGDAVPSLLVLGALATTIGLVYVALAATAPFLQSRAAAAGDGNALRLYAWSNAGSFLALAAYPFALEPWVGVRGRAWAWSIAYVAFIGVCGAALWRTRHAPTAPVPAGGAPPGRSLRARWMALAGSGVVLLMGTTEAIQQDLSVTPLLWVLPLMAYLASYVVAFARPRWFERRIWTGLSVVAFALMVWMLHRGAFISWRLQLLGWCSALFVLCAVAHGELARTAPGGAFLTRFYLDLSLGGAAGGLLAGLVAPLVLPDRFELHLGLMGLWGLLAWRWWRRPTAGFESRDFRRLVVLAASLALFGGLVGQAWKRLRGASLQRNFYGVLQVKQYTPKNAKRALLHLLDGRISHGFQFVDPSLRRQPTTYFERHTGVGQILSRPGTNRRVGILGLGVGTLASYGRTGDRFTFFELNPAVVEVARRDFTFLSDSQAQVEIVLGDGRLTLAPRAERYDVLVLDAFTGDAIPTHLLTAEAMVIWLDHLAERGVLAVNVSNRHTDLRRVVVAHTRRHGLQMVWVRAFAKAPLGRYQSDWLLLSREPLTLQGDRELTVEPFEWTDDHAPILPLLR